jgi:predicted DNA-binding transcriptional regulator AlpA
MESTTLLDFQQLCTRYPLKPFTVRAYCSQGKIPYVKIGRKVFFRVEEIEQWLDQQARPARDAVMGQPQPAGVIDA